LDEAVRVGGVPFEVAERVGGRADVGLQEESAGVGVGPVGGEGVFAALFEGFDDFLEGLVFADEPEGGAGADAFDGVDVVAAEEDAEVDELWVVLSATVLCVVGGWEGRERGTCSLSISRPSSTLSRWISWIGSLRCSLKVRWRSSTGALKVSVSISSDAAAYTLPARASTAH